MEEEIRDLKSQVTTLTQIISGLQLQLNNKVDKNEVIASINISDEAIRIIGDKIHVDKNTLIEKGGSQ